MRIIAVGLPAVLLLVSFAAGASAQSVSVDIPIVYTFDEQLLDDESASGIKVAISFPFLLGFGLEGYKVTGKDTGTTDPGTTTDFQYDVAFFDVFVDIPFPVANLVLGGGVGKGEFDLVSAPGGFNDATLTQLFVSLGIPFAAIFDAHVGYHVIRGESDIQGATSPLNLDAEMATIGLKVGF
ncbi:MAG: hypothetical protein IIA40_03975 [SAR324 cluster bacterium]|nr:hypothetical protein [SAR324 cluster bacterium]